MLLITYEARKQEGIFIRISFSSCLLLLWLASMLGCLELVQGLVIKVTLLINASHSFVYGIGKIRACKYACMTRTALSGLCMCVYKGCSNIYQFSSHSASREWIAGDQGSRISLSRCSPFMVLLSVKSDTSTP